MLGYLNGLGRARKSSGSTTKTKTLLKKAFKVLPVAVAVKVAKKVIAKNKTKPRSASPNTQFRALKNAVAQKKAQTFIKKNKTLFLDDTDLTETPTAEENIIDDQINQEVENEIETEEAFEEEQADLGVYYPSSIGGKADRKARREAKIEKKKSKTDIRKAKAQLKLDKGEAKKMRAGRERKSGRDMFKDVVDSAKEGLSVYSQFKGGGDPQSNMPNIRTGEETGEQTFFEKNKTMLIVGGAGLLVAGFLLMKNKKK